MEEEKAFAKRRKIDHEGEGRARADMPEGHHNETDVGIEEYVSDGHPFSGILKHRFSDFIVNEIGLDGNETATAANEEPAEDEPANQHPEVADPFETLAQTQTEDTVARLRAFVESAPPAQTLILPADGDKGRRTLLHQAVKQSLPGLVSDTVRDDAGDICVRIYRKGQAGGRAEDRRVAKAALPGEYCEFFLYKTQRDTNGAVGIISKLARLPSKSFSYAGTKDKRAITCQRVRCHKARAEDLHSLNGRLYGMRLGHYSYHSQQLRLGDLLGNKFTVVMRDVQGITDEALSRKLYDAKSKGFINYFGMQRFGTSTIGTQEIGRAVLKGDFEAAVNLVLTPRASEEPEVARARRHFADNPDDYKGAMKLFPRWCAPEIAVLAALSRDSKNYQAALMKVSRNVRLMYVHAYQSYIWNKVASARVRLYGLKVVPGDLVVEGDPKALDKPDEDAADAVNKFVEARVVTEQDVAEGRYQLTDVVLPMPGFDVQYPANEIAAMYRQLIKDDLGLEEYDWRHPIKDFALPGAYRKLLVIPTDLEWRIVRYNEPDQQITHSDLERLQGEPAPELPTEGAFTALLMSFTLPASAYATMLFRELTRSETHAQYHAAKSEKLAADQ